MSVRGLLTPPDTDLGEATGVPESARVWTFRVAAGLFTVAACFHAACLVDPGLGEPSPPWRHAVFLGINLGAAAGLLFRPRWFFFAFALLLGQQLASHGMDGWRVWTEERRIDWASIAVLAGMPLVAVALTRERKRSAMELGGALLALLLGASLAVLDACARDATGTSPNTSRS